MRGSIPRFPAFQGKSRIIIAPIVNATGTTFPSNLHQNVVATVNRNVFRGSRNVNVDPYVLMAC